MLNQNSPCKNFSALLYVPRVLVRTYATLTLHSDHETVTTCIHVHIRKMSILWVIKNKNRILLSLFPALLAPPASRWILAPIKILLEIPHEKSLNNVDSTKYLSACNSRLIGEHLGRHFCRLNIPVRSNCHLHSYLFSVRISTIKGDVVSAP